jgi:hypothetical protein
MSTTTNEATKNGNLRDAWRSTPKQIKWLMGGAVAVGSGITAAITIPLSYRVGKKKGAKKAKDLFYAQQNGQAQPQQDQQQGQPNQQNAQQQAGPQQNQQAQGQQQAQ